MITNIVGIDCATDPKKTGLAFARYSGNGCPEIKDIDLGNGDKRYSSLSSRIESWIGDSKNKADRTLLALDAPLGWPDEMHKTLKDHAAGQRVCPEPDNMFYRETDRLVKGELRMSPMAIGADKIARTAHSALALLNDMHARLAWSPDNLTGIDAIEVYPAATLCALGVNYKGYKTGKDKKKILATREIIKEVEKHINFSQGARKKMEGSHDLLDAAICVLAGYDFLRGRCRSPSGEQAGTARKEGWIWVRKKDSNKA